MPTIDSKADEQHHIAHLESDVIATILFETEPRLKNQEAENLIRRRTSSLIFSLYKEYESETISLDVLKEKLSKLDDFLSTKGRLSGGAMLAVCKELKIICPDWIDYLPNSVGVVYEQVRLARIWASLLNAQALENILQAVKEETELGDGYL